MPIAVPWTRESGLYDPSQAEFKQKICARQHIRCEMWFNPLYYYYRLKTGKKGI